MGKGSYVPKVRCANCQKWYDEEQHGLCPFCGCEEISETEEELEDEENLEDLEEGFEEALEEDEEERDDA